MAAMTSVGNDVLSALFASVNSLSPIIENGLWFGSLRKCLSMAALIEVSVALL